MTSQTLQSQVYLKFLNLAQKVRTLPAFPILDALEERLLNVLAVEWADGRSVTVLSAMGILVDASPTTLHRRLKSLRAKGVIDLHIDQVDNRIKYVVPTDLAQRYFSQMGACMAQAQQTLPELACAA